jgi:uncharacterized protein YidB (DUF937 family)
MSFFDDIVKTVEGAGGLGGTDAAPAAAPGVPGAPAGAVAGASAPLLQEAMGLLTNNSAGGVSGLVQQFESQGLGHIIGSWMGPGQNLPISGQQLHSVLGGQQLQELAQRVGLPPEAAANALAAVLPALVDRVTPNGSIEHTLLQQGLGWLEGRQT